MKYLVTLAAASAALTLASCDKKDGFEVADADADKNISYTEFDRYMLEAIYTAIDTNGDAKVTLEEYKAADTTATEAGFKEVDANGDGIITPAEAKAFWDAKGTMKELFKKIDTDGDGTLNQAEVQAFYDKAAEAEGDTDLEKLSNAAAQ